MTPQELKSSILQNAVQGKLVEQRPEEGTGADLFQQIQAEKQTMIKTGKIKTEKPLPEIAEDEVLFDIPGTWCWVRLADLVEIYTGKKDANFGSPDGQYDFFTCSNQPIKCKSYSYDGEYLIMPGNGANIGMVMHYQGKFEAYQRTYLLENTYGIFMKYLKHHLESNWKQYNADKMYGSAIPYIKLGNLTNYCVALPPLAEQKRIVAKLEEILPLIDRYETAWNKLEEFNKRFPGDMQKSILQLAIQGKLVEQRPEEGTGEDLFQQIQAEKQALIKAGKIKKEKPVSEIVEDEVPFEIPNSWRWVHLNQIAISNLGKTLDKAKNTGELCPYLCSINVYWSGIDLSKVKEARFEEAEQEKYLLQQGDLLVCEGGDCGRAAIWESEQTMYYQNALHRIRFYGNIDPHFYRFLLEYYKKAGIIEQYSKGETIKHLVQNALYAMWMPLPPLAEQKRIVAKLEEILPLCDRLK